MVSHVRFSFGVLVSRLAMAFSSMSFLSHNASSNGLVVDDLDPALSVIAILESCSLFEVPSRSRPRAPVFEVLMVVFSSCRLL